MSFRIRAKGSAQHPEPHLRDPAGRELGKAGRRMVLLVPRVLSNFKMANFKDIRILCLCSPYINYCVNGHNTHRFSYNSQLPASKCLILYITPVVGSFLVWLMRLRPHLH